MADGITIAGVYVEKQGGHKARQDVRDTQLTQYHNSPPWELTHYYQT